jgi:hypothetical protein
MSPTLVSILGSLIVFLLGLILYMIKSTRNDIEKLEIHVDLSLSEAKREIMDRVQRPDCIREMATIREDLKDAVKDIRTLERGK